MLKAILILVILFLLYLNSNRKFRKKILREIMKIFLSNLKENLSTDKFSIKSISNHNQWILKISKTGGSSFECEFDDLRFLVDDYMTKKLPRFFVRAYSTGDTETINHIMNRLDNFVAFLYLTNTNKCFWDNLIDDFSESHLCNEVTFILSNLKISLYWGNSKDEINLFFSPNNSYADTQLLDLAIKKNEGISIKKKQEIEQYLITNLEEDYGKYRCLEILRSIALSLNNWNEEKIDKYKIPLELHNQVFYNLLKEKCAN